MHARPGQTLREALNAATPITSGGQRFHGYTHWNVRWNFWWQQDTRRPLPHHAREHPAAVAHPDARTARHGGADGGQFCALPPALRQHELGHVESAAVAQAIDRGIAALPLAPIALRGAAGRVLASACWLNRCSRSATTTNASATARPRGAGSTD